jgi:uncharacterized protein (DUF433 family)
MQPIKSTTIEVRPNREGQQRAYIGDGRVRVIDVYAMAELQGLCPDEIAVELPQLTLAHVHSALAYYFANREEIVRQLREEEDLVQRFRALTGPGPMETRLLGREATRDPLSS